jgi:CheY-like chemotaxis protein
MASRLIHTIGMSHTRSTSLILGAEPAIQWSPSVVSSQEVERISNVWTAKARLLADTSYRPERIIIDGEATNAAEWLEFLAALPSDFHGDVLMIEDATLAFLSAAGAEGRRVLYTLARHDVDFYLWVYQLGDAPDRAKEPGMVPIRVLIADDHCRTRETVGELLRELGCEVFFAKSGFEAIRVADHHRPQVVFLDGLMPEMTGFEAARFIRKLSGGYNPRIVMLTAVYKKAGYRNDAKLRYGVDGYLVKPVAREELASAIFDNDGAWSLSQAPTPVMAATAS